MPWDPLEERLQALEAGPYLCRSCGTPYNSRLAALACCDEDD